MATPNGFQQRSGHQHFNALATLATLTTMSILLPHLHAQLLHPIDMIALREIKASIHDLPGGTFFASWTFSLTTNPCQTFTGLQCTPIGSFNRVTSLSLGPSTAGTPGLTGYLPLSLGSLTHLQTLTISSGALRGTIPSTIGNLKNLRTFSLSPNYLQGPIPPSLTSLPLLETLQLRKNNLEGQIPSGISNLAHLKVLILSENRFWGPVPDLSHTSLLHLDLRNNEFSGELPGLPGGLEYFSATRNRFVGELAGLASLGALGYLDLGYNGFSGGIPSNLFGVPMQFLMLDHNALRGAVSVGAEVAMAVVDLSHNRLQGGISPNLAGAQSLFLNNNLFVGTVPQEFASKMQEETLQSLYLQHNYLTDSGALANATLPPSAAVCLQYNCMVPPSQSLCPPNVALPASRPGYQCLKSSTGSPGDR